MFLDIGVGILVSIALADFWNIQLSGWLVAAGVFFALLPDADFIVHLARSGWSSKNAHRHRELFHYPLIYIPVGTAALSFFGSEWAVLFAVSSFLHFLHDSIGIGWGVQWLWPFGKDHYEFFYAYQPPDKPPLSRKLLYVWKHDQMPALVARYGDEHWIRNIYLNFHPYFIVEISVFAIGVIALLTRFYKGL